MFKLILPLYFQLLCFSLQAQEFTIANQTQNIAYPGLSNPLKCTVSNYSADAVEMTTDNGAITKEGPGVFSFIPKNSGPTLIQVWVKTKSGKLTVGEYPIRVKNFPKPLVYIGIHQSGTISTQTLLKIGGIRAMMHPDLGCDLPVRVVSFEALSISGDSCDFRFANIGAPWNEANKKFLENLAFGNSILFHNINCQMPDGSMMMANEIFLKIE
jgi:hypothetical protein